MRKHIFTLGLILTSIYTVPAVADDWPTQATIRSNDVWMDSKKTKEAMMHCKDCCKHDCWLPELPDGQYYYDDIGGFVVECSEEEQPKCEEDATYSFENGKCIANKCDGIKLGDNMCADLSKSGTILKTSREDWTVSFSYGQVSGTAQCTLLYMSDNTKYSPTPTISPDPTGNFCWCQMTQPSKSEWIYLGDSTQSCSNSCAQTCASEVASQSAMRESMYENLIQ